MKKQMLHVIFGVSIICCLTGCGIGQTSSGSGAGPKERNSSAIPMSTSDDQAAVAEYSGIEDGILAEKYLQEFYKEYEEFGLIYDAQRDEWTYYGKLVRCFEDYYEIESDNNQAGICFFNGDGIVDVYAVRDQDNPVRNPDGSYDPRGKLLGLKQSSQKEFDSRDLDPINNLQMAEASTGPLPTPEENQKMASEYEAFGVTYDSKEDQWYYFGEKVRCFRDVLTSNGESLNGGHFTGDMRTSQNPNGVVDIYTVRDYERPNAEGNGTLTAIKKNTNKDYDTYIQENSNTYDTYGATGVES